MKARYPFRSSSQPWLCKAGWWQLLTTCLLVALPGYGQLRKSSSRALISFTAIARGRSYQLQWVTAHEPQLLLGVAVERSLNGYAFQRLATLPDPSWVDAGLGKYEWPDTTLSGTRAPWVYYRLRLLGVDGTESFSPVRAVQPPKIAEQFTVYPTVRTDGPFRYQYNGVLAPDAVLEVSNNMGQLICRQAARASLTTCIALPYLPFGWYVVRLHNVHQSHISSFYQQ